LHLRASHNHQTDATVIKSMPDMDESIAREMNVSAALTNLGWGENVALIAVTSLLSHNCIFSSGGWSKIINIRP
jgi:hypothetical protein